MPSAAERSPYRQVLGDRFDELHPRLQAYFDAIPPGAVGRGRGVFDTVGTPRAWLRPLLALFGRGVVFPVWARGVPFSVENRPVTRADGSPAVAAVREFHLSTGTRRMVDEIGVTSDVLDDRLGRPVRALATFRADIREGGLRLRSDRVTLAIGRISLALPRMIAPVIVLTERYDEMEDCQRVSITVTVPILGRVYQYAGWFRYTIDARESR